MATGRFRISHRRLRAFSGGLEAAWQHGEVRDAAELASFLEASLRQLGARHACRLSPPRTTQPEQLRGTGSLVRRFLTNHVANRASRAARPRFLASARKNLSPIATSTAAISPSAISRRCSARSRARCRSEPITRGAIVLFPTSARPRGRRGSAGHRRPDGRRKPCSIGWRRARGKYSAQCEHLPVDDIAQTAPLLEIWQGTQDRLYSRLFQS